MESRFRELRYIAARDVLILPDFVVNTGGVICAASEYHGGSEMMALVAIDEKIRRNSTSLIEKSRRDSVSTREPAIALMTERARNAQRTRRWRWSRPTVVAFYREFGPTPLRKSRSYSRSCASMRCSISLRFKTTSR